MKQLCFWLTVIGGLNWGLVGLFNWNLVEALSFGMAWLPTLIYIIVGVSAATSTSFIISPSSLSITKMLTHMLNTLPPVLLKFSSVQFSHSVISDSL